MKTNCAWVAVTSARSTSAETTFIADAPNLRRRTNNVIHPHPNIGIPRSIRNWRRCPSALPPPPPPLPPWLPLPPRPPAVWPIRRHRRCHPKDPTPLRAPALGLGPAVRTRSPLSTTITIHRINHRHHPHNSTAAAVRGESEIDFPLLRILTTSSPPPPPALITRECRPTSIRRRRTKADDNSRPIPLPPSRLPPIWPPVRESVWVWEWGMGMGRVMGMVECTFVSRLMNVATGEENVVQGPE